MAKQSSPVTAGQAIAVFAAVLLSGLALASTAAAAGKKIDRFFPPKIGTNLSGTGVGTVGGEFEDPGSVAFNDPAVDDGNPGADGDFYVVDSGNNRIQRFEVDDNGTPGDTSDDSEVFVSAFGANTVKPGGAGDLPGATGERQRISINATGGSFALAPNVTFDPGVAGQGANAHFTLQIRGEGGTFTLSFHGDSTEPLPRGASGSEIQAALEALPTIGAGNVIVTGGSSPVSFWDIEFTGDFAGTEVTDFAASGSGLTGSPKSANLSSGLVSPPIPFDATAAELQTVMEELDAIGSGNVSVSGPAGGPWEVEYQGDLIGADVETPFAYGVNLTGGSTSVTRTVLAPATAPFEICTVAADCRGAIPGSTGGQMNRPEGLAIAQSTGDLYVLDAGNQRVQRFDADGNFIAAFGANTIVGGGSGDKPGPNERQSVLLEGNPRPPGGPSPTGTFKLTFGGQTTGPIAHDASAATVQAALEALSNIAPGDVSVTDWANAQEPASWFVDFTGSYALADVPELSGDPTGLSTFNPAVRIATQREANGNFEVCTVASDCRAGFSSPIAGGLSKVGSASMNGVAVSPLNDHVIVADPGGGSPGVSSTNRINEYGPDGEFIRSWGWGVEDEARGFQICTAATECFRHATNTGFGTSPQLPNGFFGGSGTPLHIAVDGNGVVYASDCDGFGTGCNDNFRVMRFDSAVAGDGAGAEGALLLPALKADANFGDPYEMLPDGRVFAMTVDLGLTGERLFLSRGPVTRELDVSVEPPVLSPDIHMEGSGLQPNGYAVDPVTDNLYMSSSRIASSVFAHRIYVADDDGAGPPSATIEDPPTGIGPFEATFKGSVDPEGFAGSLAQFEVSKDGGATWSPVGTPRELPGVNEEVEVVASATTLVPATDYQVRLKVSRPYGAGIGYSALVPFATAAGEPVPVTGAVLENGATRALLSGSVNPNGKPTTYYFEFVDRAEFDVNGFDNAVRTPEGDAGSGGTPVPVKEQLADLTPRTTYHYRLVASDETQTVFGAARTFTTTAVAYPAPSGRGYEMVTPPFKATRSTASAGDAVENNPNPALVSLDGESLIFKTDFLPLTDEVGAAGWGDNNLLRRTPQGWTMRTLNTASFLPHAQPTYVRSELNSSSGDYRTLGWDTYAGDPQAGLLPPEGGYLPSKLYTRRDGTGTGSFTSWVPNPEQQQIGVGFSETEAGDPDLSILNDDGTAMARAGWYRGLAEDPSVAGDEDPSDEQQLSGVAGGPTIYIQRVDDPDALPAAPKDLVSECTGSGASATLLPTRVGSGIATDTIGTRACGKGNVISNRGAGLPAHPATALSDDGARVFFRSPVYGAGGGPGASSCTTATGAATMCPSQLFVRQYDESGAATVRWISRSRSVAAGGNSYDGAMIAGQRISAIGSGAIFEGASRDGGTVYFRTTAPLVPNDPNGGSPVTTGPASDQSWDLYRYELPDDLGSDPEDGALTRVSGGPTGIADASTNAFTGAGGALRYLSDDGERAYFVASAPIAGSDATPPTGGSTTPGGAVGNTVSRNLYLYDASDGSPSYRFIAQLPFATNGLNACAAYGEGQGEGQLRFGGAAGAGTDPTGIAPANTNCFRGTADGRYVVFASAGELTADDEDSAGDVYLYDAVADELTRVSAPPAFADPYGCDILKDAVEAECNGDLGPVKRGIASGTETGETTRGWGGNRYNNVALNDAGEVSVFFESRSQLVAADRNGNHWDVYEWRGGDLRLISPGSTPDDSWFSGNSTDGEDVFFVTSAPIDPREIDPADQDIYDARVGGGFPYTPPARPCDVLALECEVEAIPPPQTPTGTTGSAPSSGNVTPPKAKQRCKKGKVRRGKRCVSKKPAKAKRCAKGKKAKKGKKKNCTRRSNGGNR